MRKAFLSKCIIKTLFAPQNNRVLLYRPRGRCRRRRHRHRKALCIQGIFFFRRLAIDVRRSAMWHTLKVAETLTE